MPKTKIEEAHRFGKRFLETVYRDIVTKDIIKRHKIKAVAELEIMAKYLISNYSNEFTFSKLRKVAGIKKIETVRNFFKYLRDAYLIFMLERFSPRLKEQILAPKKVYCLDTGIISAVSLKLGGDFGRIMENLVAVELLRMKYYWHNDWDIYYWKDHRGNEVDFVIKKGKDKKMGALVQVGYVCGPDEVDRRKLKALVGASRELNCKKPALHKLGL